MAQQRKLSVVWAVPALLLSAAIGAQNYPAGSGVHAADNTAVNARDRSDASKTSMAQPNDQTDIKLAAIVRRAISKDSSLSTMAHNVKIVAANGTVTLRGSVKGDDEKSEVETVVRSVDGVQRVTNDLDVSS